MPKGIIAVHLFSLPGDYRLINIIARKHDAFIIEDSAQSFGAEYHGKKPSSFGNIARTSLLTPLTLQGRTLPMSPELQESQIKYIADKIREFGLSLAK